MIDYYADRAAKVYASWLDGQPAREIAEHWWIAESTVSRIVSEEKRKAALEMDNPGSAKISGRVLSHVYMG